MSDNVVDYGWRSAESPCSHGYITPRIIEVLKRLAVNRVLDIGAGNGTLCATLAREGFVAVGVENDRNGVEVARDHFRHIPFHHFGVQHDPASLLQMQTQPFDAVVSTEVVEHLYAPHLLPKYARAVLKPDGWLVVTTPYHGYLKNLALSLFDKWDLHHTALWHGGHIKFWSRLTLTRLLNENGFDVVEFHGVGRVPYLWKSMVLVARLRASEMGA